MVLKSVTSLLVLLSFQWSVKNYKFKRLLRFNVNRQHYQLLQSPVKYPSKKVHERKENGRININLANQGK